MAILEVKIKIRSRVLHLIVSEHFPEINHLIVKVIKNDNHINNVVLDYDINEYIFTDEKCLSNEEKKKVKTVLSLYKENFIS